MDGKPYWQITDNCVNLIKELGNAVHDETIVEDLQGAFDHALDDQRYMLKAIKWIDARVGTFKPRRVQLPKNVKSPLTLINTDAFR